MDIGKSLRTLMYVRNVNAVGLAKELNVSPQTITLWKQNKVFPHRKYLEKMAELGGVTVGLFIGWGEQEN